ncbi:TrkH family potassium uptake protein [Proteiniclasticum sp. SCR006]|uniref:TrkH family potassium uptake protein n=1 Tax=Proteiniclasticum aestuarii TaxID=2817862 RepID=A0A939KG08_9CLOT|nr:TrkH family potassium uptake protein [Proteiniclasticum aestuarii]
MNYGIVIKVLGIILLIESLLMSPAIFISQQHGGEAVRAFLLTIAVMLVIGLIMMNVKSRKDQIRAKDGIVIVALGWLMISIFGALPLYLTESVPHYVDALFEIISGFTTTGSSVIADVESLDKGILFWRSMTHWIGGMGILVFTLALLPALGVGSLQIFKAESPGPVAGKIVPRMKDTARVLYITYIAITLIELVFLLFGGVNLIDSFVITFGTVGTGGFGPRNDSLASYSSYVHIVTGIFMVLSGVNFSLYFLVFRKKYKDFLEDRELRLYLFFIFSAVVMIAVNLLMTFKGDVFISIRDSFFQVASIMTTTGFSTVDYEQWPSFSKLILFFLMFIGGSAGSTAGGMKVIRIMIILKLIKREVSKIFHPRALIPIKVGGKIVSNEVIARINSFLALHLVIFVIGVLVVSLEGVDMISSISSVAATINNIGPGFGSVGPTMTFADYSIFTKLFLSLVMLLGRLEHFTIIALLVPKTWTRES